MKLFDTHAHINDNRFDNDRADMLQACFDAGVEYIMIPGVDRQTVESGVALAETDDRLYAAVGTHPHEAKDFTDDDYEFVTNLINASLLSCEILDTRENFLKNRRYLVSMLEGYFTRSTFQEAEVSGL